MSMKTHGISQLPVVEEGRLVGILTESDVLSRLVTGSAKNSTTVAEVMFRNVDTVHAAADASELLELFAKDEVGLVVDDGEHLVGILTKMDLVDHLTAAVSAG